MAGELLQLGYRDIAERLGISPDAARMKAKRAAKKGRWRIIPGNHPSDRVLVELPADDLNTPERVGGEQAPNVQSEHTPPTYGGEQANALALQALQAAQERITELTGQLLAEKDEHRQTAIERAQAETRGMGLAGEIERLESTVAQLAEDLRLERRSWWQRITAR